MGEMMKEQPLPFPPIEQSSRVVVYWQTHNALSGSFPWNFLDRKCSHWDTLLWVVVVQELHWERDPRDITVQAGN